MRDGGVFIKGHDYLSVSDFIKITRTTRHTLHHYDKFGLLSPAFRGENKYRYYSIRQLAMCNTIRLLQKIGVPLAEIKALKDERTPETTKEILLRQIDNLNLKKDKIDQARKLLLTMLQTIQSGLDADHEKITIQYLPAEQIILGEPNKYGGTRNDYNALYDFYESMYEKCEDADYELDYPVWAVFSEERIRNRDFDFPDRFYFYNPSGKDQRPAALYAIGYMRSGYGHNAELYQRMIEYIDKNGFEICGDAYEEYPLNEVCISDDTNYLMRVMITVHEKTDNIQKHNLSDIE